MNFYVEIDENNKAISSVIASNEAIPEGAVQVSPVENVQVGATWDGVSWVNQALSVEEFRSRRNILLAESDWTQMPDSPLSSADKDSWAAYRQNLRDALATYDGTTYVALANDPDEAAVTEAQALADN